MQVRHAATAVAATQALSKREGGEVLSVSRDEVGGEQNAAVLAAPTQGALNAVAQMRAGRVAGGIVSFREMQEQARKVDRRRVEIAVRIAELQGN